MDLLITCRRQYLPHTECTNRYKGVLFINAIKCSKCHQVHALPATLWNYVLHKIAIELQYYKNIWNVSIRRNNNYFYNFIFQVNDSKRPDRVREDDTFRESCSWMQKHYRKKETKLSVVAKKTTNTQRVYKPVSNWVNRPKPTHSWEN